jgi:PAS domain-containing protein
MNLIVKHGFPALNLFTAPLFPLDSSPMKSSLSSSSRLWITRLLPFLFFILVWAIESSTTRLFGDQTLAPLLSILSLAILAFFCPPIVIALSTPIFVLESYLLLSDHSLYPLVRALTVAMGGCLAFFVSVSQAKLFRERLDIEGILQLLPVPWIQADSSGNMIRFSRSALDVLGVSETEVIGTPFFSLFSAAQNNGDFIRIFLEVSDTPSTAPHQNLFLTLTRAPHTQFNVSLSHLLSIRGPTVLIILSPIAPASRTKN